MNRLPMPSDTERQQLGRAASSIVETWSSRNGFIFRREDQATDFGIDAEIEPTGTGPSAALVKLQIKGTSQDIPFTRAGKYKLYDVSTSTMNYWAALPLNVVVLLIDVNRGRIYWSSPVPVFGMATPSVTFRADRCVNDDPVGFRALIHRLGSTSSKALVLDQIPQVLAGYADVRGQVGRQDPGSQLTYLQEGLLERAYEHVAVLCDMFGFERRPYSLHLWRARSDYATDAVFDGGAGDDGLLDLVAAEMIHHLEPFYSDALRAVAMLAETHNLAEYHPKIASWVESGILDEGPLAAFFSRDSYKRHQSFDDLLGAGRWTSSWHGFQEPSGMAEFERRLVLDDAARFLAFRSN